MHSSHYLFILNVLMGVQHACRMAGTPSVATRTCSARQAMQAGRPAGPGSGPPPPSRPQRQTPCIVPNGFSAMDIYRPCDVCAPGHALPCYPFTPIHVTPSPHMAPSFRLQTPLPPPPCRSGSHSVVICGFLIKGFFATPRGKSRSGLDRFTMGLRLV